MKGYNMIIEGGTGNGYSVGVSSENRLKTTCVSVTLEHHINHHEGKFYSVGTRQTPTGADDCFLYIKNNDDENMIITGFNFTASSDEWIYMKLGDAGTPVGGSAVTPVNRNAGSGNIADVDAQAGVDITGLSGGQVVGRMFLKGGETSSKRDICSDFIVPKNKTITFYVENGAIPVTVGIPIYFHNSGEE